MIRKDSQKLFDLSNKSIVLTGSAGRLGTNFAQILSDAGANLILVDIDEKKNEKLEKNISKKFKTKCICSNTNITNKLELEKLCKLTLKKFGTIDGLVNNAFYSPRTNIKKSAMKFEDYQSDLWNDVVSVNLTGVFLCCKYLEKLCLNKKRVEQL